MPRRPSAGPRPRTAAARSPRTRSPPTSARHPQTATTIIGSPPATIHDDHRPDQRHELHVHRRRHQRDRDRTSIDAVQRGHPDRADRPAAPSNVTATAGNATATVSWTAPIKRRQPDHLYTITPYIGSTAQTATTIIGSPPATTTTITGLTNGTSYTFTVAATNLVGTGLASTASNAVTPTAASPAFVQQVSSHAVNVTSRAVTPSSNITAGNRLVVLVGVWNNSGPTAKSVTDSAGNTYTEVLHFKASDKSEMSVWTAPITVGAGTRPAITVTATARADVGVAALEYSGLSSASGTGAIDQTSQNTGKTAAAATVSSGATPATTAGNELAVGFYVDSGFGDTLTAGTGFTTRTNVSNASDMELLAEDQVPAQGATPNASAGTGANTVWLMSTVVFKHS